MAYEGIISLEKEHFSASIQNSYSMSGLCGLKLGAPVLKRKIEKNITTWIESGDKALLVCGVRQAGKFRRVRHIFFDEIQQYKDVVTKIKFWVEDGRFQCILSDLRQ